MTFALPAAAGGIALLALLTFAVVAGLRLEQPWLQPWAVLRATAQLGALSLVLRVVVEQSRYVLLFLVVMVVAAAWVVARRLRWDVRRGVLAAGVHVVAAGLPCVTVFATGVLVVRPQYLLALGGIVIGGVMTASTLFGRALQERLAAEHASVEAWLALGAPARHACREPVRAAGSLALMPATDQTRVTGVVTLPGAFVGAVFAGLPVAEAAVFQLVVLASILAAGAVAVALWTWLLGAPVHLARDPA